MSSQATLPGIPSAIFSRASGAGAMPCASLAGQMTAPCGRAPVRVNLSARQAKERGLLMSGTFGPRSSISSASAALTRSLVSRLRAKTVSFGSTLYNLIWRERVTPSGRLIPALRATARRISDSACTGWLTPSARDWKDSPGMATELPGERKRLDQLPRQAYLVGWWTPLVADAQGDARPLRYKGVAPSEAGHLRNPSAQGSYRGNLKDWIALLLNPHKDSGEMLTGSCAETANTGQLNPAHTRWLMGFPPEWDACAATATPLSRRKPRRS